MNKAAAWLIALTIFSVVFPVVALEGSPSIVYVPRDYPTIQEAVYATSKGDTIQVASGTYNESISVGDRSGLSIIGDDKDTTFIIGVKHDYAISIWSDGVRISGFTIKEGDMKLHRSSGCRITDNVIANGDVYINGECYGVTVENNIINGSISVSGSNNNINKNDIYRLVIRDLGGNNIENNNIEVLLLDVSPNNNFRQNNISRVISITGVELSHFLQNMDASNMYRGRPIYYLSNQNDLVIDSFSYPDAGYLAFINSHNIRVRNRDFSNRTLFFAYCKGCNISFSKFQDAYGTHFVYSNENFIENNLFINNSCGIAFYDSNNNTVNSNALLGCRVGIYFHDSSNNLIINNTVSKNIKGVYLTYQTGGNIFYSNNFIENTCHVDFYVHPIINEQFWDDGEHVGNYWSNYSGQDSNGDGIGDTPYFIDKESQDNYPLMSPTTLPTTAETEPEQGEPEEKQERPTNIPGFLAISIILGLLLGYTLLRRNIPKQSSLVIPFPKKNINL